MLLNIKFNGSKNQVASFAKEIPEFNFFRQTRGLAIEKLKVAFFQKVLFDFQISKSQKKKKIQKAILSL